MTTREQIAALYAKTDAQRHGPEAAERIIADLAVRGVEIEAAIEEQSRACC
ncbi:MAG: hypothetical protein M0015_16705 [Betaproteobacteria bacterium]|nr:hypothetical protein [Betaproteobacteria bacterium]